MNRGAEEEEDSRGEGTGVEAEQPSDALGLIADPFNPEDIDVVTRMMTVDLLLSRARSGMVDLQPEFQRRWGIWDQRRQSRLINPCCCVSHCQIFTPQRTRKKAGRTTQIFSSHVYVAPPPTDFTGSLRLAPRRLPLWVTSEGNSNRLIALSHAQASSTILEPQICICVQSILPRVPFARQALAALLLQIIFSSGGRLVALALLVGCSDGSRRMMSPIAFRPGVSN